MAILVLPKGISKKVSDHFDAIEFSCPCTDCKTTLIDEDLLTKLEAMRKELGTTLHIESGYRCSGYQAQLRLRGYETAKGISQHTLGRAADVTNGVALGAELEEAARKGGFMAVGISRHWVHVDTRDGHERRWYYSKR